MDQYKNLLQSMSSVFNETAGNENSDFDDINNDKTLKWKTLHNNQYASKQEGRKVKNNINNEYTALNNTDAHKIKSNGDKQENCEEESLDCNLEQYKNLLQSMSSAFNETTCNENSDLDDIYNDRTLKWKTLHNNQYASKQEGRKVKNIINNECTSLTNDTRKTKDNVVKRRNYEVESWDCNSSTSSDSRTVGKHCNNKRKLEEKIENRKSKRRRKSSNFQNATKLRLRSVIQRNKKKDNIVSTSITNNNIVLNSSQSTDEEIFHSFGRTIALQLKELNRFSKIEAHKCIQEIQNLVATRIAKILTQQESEEVSKAK